MISTTTAKSESSMTPQSTSKKQDSKTTYEEYKKQVLGESRLQSQHKSKITSIEMMKEGADKHQKHAPDMSWLINDKSEKKQHYEKTVSEIDKILSELKDRGVSEPEPVEPRPSHLTEKEDSHTVAEEQMTSRKFSNESDGAMTQTDEMDGKQRKLDEQYRNLSLDDPRKKWGEAQKTRYVRSKDKRDVDVILSTDQIFDHDSTDSSQKGWWKSYTQQCPQKQQTSPTSNKNGKKKNSIPN